ncbi:MAG: shikimate kinase [Clostridia bacterium]|nr:shikimate kinase [Clostridia bacterium]
MITGYSNMKCGVLGEHLGHSFSPMIHGLLADYSYRIIEKAPEEVENFVRSCEYDAYNVTIPYKKTVMPFLDVISPEAQKLGAVNTVVNKDGKRYGYNTDYFGFSHMIDLSGIDITGKKAMVFGTGGAAVTVCAVLRDRGVGELVSISIDDNNIETLSKHPDTEVIVNCTPVGMYPKNGESPVDLALFPKALGVLDIVYNPSKTALVLDAERRGIIAVSGLSMLVAQAVKGFEFFTGHPAEDGACERITKAIEAQTKNVVLIGMPGCGKSTVGKLIAAKLNRPFYDADEEFAKTYNVSAADIITEKGEEAFRLMEHEIAKTLGKMSGAVIACGGGVVTRDYNYDPLHQNSTIVFLERELSNLSTKGRPLSQANSLQTLYDARIGAYCRFADIRVASTEVPENTATLIIEKLGGLDK